MTNKNNLINFLSALAEASYLFLIYILLTTLCNTVPEQLLSLLGLILIVIVLYSFNIIISVKPRKRISVIFFNLVFITLISLLTLRHLNYFKASSWLNLFWNVENPLISAQAWLLVILISVIAIRVMILCNRKINLKDAIARFEVSISVFLVTAILAGLLHVEVAENFLIIILGLISNFLAIVLCKQIEHISARYLFAGTLGLAVFIGSLLALLKWGQSFLINISAWIYSSTMPFISGIFLSLMKWLLTKGKYIENNSQPNATTSNEGIASGWELPIHDAQWLKYVLWFLFGLISLLVVVILIILLVYIFKYLLKPNQKKYSQEKWLNTELNFFSILGVKIRKLVIKIKILLNIYLSKEINLERLYSYLLLWGEQKNVPRLVHETPYEYSQRLSLKYPHQTEFIRLITESYVAYKYGNIKQNQENINRLNKCIKELYFNRRLNIH